MKRFGLVLSCLLFAASVWAGINSRLNVEEVDGSPSTFPWKLKVTNGSLTDNGDGTSTLTIGAGGSGGGSSLEVFVGTARSSPTASISANSSQFVGSVSGSTFTFTLNSSSVTLLGPSISPSEMTGINAGTDLTADLEEETHASEHQDGGADEINVLGLSGLLGDSQKVTITTGTTDIATSSRVAVVAGAGITTTAAQHTSSMTVTITNTLGTTIDDTEMTAEDFGSFTCTGSEDGCTLDAGSVGTTEIANGSITGTDVDTSSFTLLGPSIDLAELPAGVGLLNSTQTWTGGNTYQGSITSISTFTINNSGTTNALKIAQTGNIGASSSVGGAINLTNTSNTGAALVAYTNQGSPLDNLVDLRVDNPTFGQAAVFVDYRGSSSAMTLRSSTTASSYALNVIGQSTGTSSFQATGSEASVGTFKITHSSPTLVPGQSDANASGISIALTGVGTAAQGLFIDATSAGGTTGKLMNIRNDGEEFFTLTAAKNTVAKYGMFASTITSPGFMVTATSSSVMGSAGLRVVYNIDAGSMTGAGLTTCGDATHGLAWTSGTNLFSCQSITGSGGGGGSTLAIATGTAAGFNNPVTSSPTAVVNFDQSQFYASLPAGTTAFVSIREATSNITGSFTFGSTSTVVIANCASACTVTLPTAVGIENKVYKVKIIGAGATSITGTSAQTLDGSTTVTPTPNLYSELEFKSDNANWNIF